MASGGDAAKLAALGMVGVFVGGFVFSAALLGAQSETQRGYSGAICAPVSGASVAAIPGLDSEQISNVEAIVGAGTQVGAPPCQRRLNLDPLATAESGPPCGVVDLQSSVLLAAGTRPRSRSLSR